MYKVNDLVEDINYGYIGYISRIYNNWEDLKQKNRFITIDRDNESEEMDNIEKLISGDPKDKWLESQNIKHSQKELNESWYSVNTHNGGSIWINESRLKRVYNNS